MKLNWNFLGDGGCKKKSSMGEVWILFGTVHCDDNDDDDNDDHDDDDEDVDDDDVDVDDDNDDDDDDDDDAEFSLSASLCSSFFSVTNKHLFRK